MIFVVPLKGSSLQCFCKFYFCLKSNISFSFEYDVTGTWCRLSKILVFVFFLLNGCNCSFCN